VVPAKLAVPSVMLMRPRMAGWATVPADAQIHASGQLGVGILKVELGRGKHVNIQPHVAGRRVRIRGHVRCWAGSKTGEVDIRADDEPRDLNTATERHVVLRADQVQGRIRGCAYTCVTNPDIFARCRKVSVTGPVGRLGTLRF